MDSEKQISDYTPKPRVLGICGSPRKNGNSDILLDHVLKGTMEHGIATDKVALRNLQFKGCIGCECCRKDKICTGLPDDMSEVYPKIIESQGLVLVSPTHNYNITSWMKAFIDRLYCFYNFEDNRPRGWSSQIENQGRKAVLVAVCEQVDRHDMGFTLEAMRLPIEALGYEVIEELPVFGIFDKAKVKEQNDVLASAISHGVKLAKSFL